WGIFRGAANALSMPAMLTDDRPSNTGLSRPAAIAASTVCSEPHRLGRPSRHSGSSPIIPFSPLAHPGRGELPFPGRAGIALRGTVIAADHRVAGHGGVEHIGMSQHGRAAA